MVLYFEGFSSNEGVDEIILEPKRIAKEYLKSYFFLDLLSSIPIDYIFLILRQADERFQLARTGRALKVFRLVKLLSLLRLLRLSRLVRYINKCGKVKRNFESVPFFFNF